MSLCVTRYELDVMRKDIINAFGIEIFHVEAQFNSITTSNNLLYIELNRVTGKLNR